MDLNDMPYDRTNMPMGVSEVTYKTQAEMDAFLNGLHYADDIDVENGEPFQRNGEWVVRVAVGEWDNEE